MTEVISTRPKYPCNDDFVTDFETEPGPGFYPGAGGYFHGCSSTCRPRTVIFGTDFGTEQYWKDEVRGKGGETQSQSTVSKLRSLILILTGLRSGAAGWNEPPIDRSGRGVPTPSVESRPAAPGSAGRAEEVLATYFREDV
jgi:hypothetical protein